MGKEYRTTYYKIAEIQNQGAAQIAQQLNIRNWQNDEKTTKQLKSTKNTGHVWMIYVSVSGSGSF
jgi:hypothetical protein